MRREIISYGKRRILRYSAGMVMILMAAFVAAGCSGVRTPTPAMTTYVLENLEFQQVFSDDYPFTPYTITVLRFTATEICQGTSMLYRFSPYERASYRYHRWKISPALMITNHLVEDLLRSRLFKAVFTDYAYEKSRYHLEGRVIDCIEIIEADRREVSLEFSAALIDTSSHGAENRILFQNSYKHRRIIEVDGPAGTAAAMSEALAILSESLRSDILAVLR